MKKTIKQMLTGLGFVTMMTVLSVTGCGLQDGSNPLSSDNSAITADSGGVLTKSNKGRNATVTDGATTDATTSSATQAAPDYVKTKLVRARRGAYMVLNTDGFIYALEIPAGALKQDTQITMTVPDGNKSMVIFEPHGIQFLKPVKLQMDVNIQKAAILDPNPGSDVVDPIDIYYLNELTGSWEAQGSDVSWDTSFNNWVTARANLNHFSRYALGGDSPRIQKWEYQYGSSYDSYSPYSPY